MFKIRSAKLCCLRLLQSFFNANIAISTSILAQDEVLIPLLLEELPTAKEFKDAVKSLSPEQQRFARAYRSMQLASSVFGVCIIQVKPQLEALLGLPADALDKEMQLTQDLMELFIEYQIPSDMLSYNGAHENVSLRDILSNVKSNVKGVMDVLSSEKEKQLKSEQAKTKMALEKAVQSAVEGAPPYSAELDGRLFGGIDAPMEKANHRLRGSRSRALASEPMMMMMAQKCAPAPSMAYMKQATNQEATAEDYEPPLFNSEADSFPENAQPFSDQHGVDFTLTPKILDAAIEANGEGNALRSTTIKPSSCWERHRQENILSSRRTATLTSKVINDEKNKAFDLLDALSRSGSLPIAFSDLHVVVAVTHCFDKDVMSTVVCDNVNPIEKLERSTLLLASTVHGVPARELIGNASELQRLERSMPLLLQSEEANE